MLHEYEFRLVVEHSSSFLPLLQSIGHPVEAQWVYYVKPHFRFRNGTLETKRIESTHAIYHDGLWFKWVHSIETAHRSWNRGTCLTFLHNIGNFQDPIHTESRSRIAIDSHAQLYCFQKEPRRHRLVFEWEYGTFSKPVTHFDSVTLLGALNRYKHLYNLMRGFSLPTFKLDEMWTRRPVTCIASIPEGEPYVYAHKLDGTFGLVHSYGDRIKEKWEGYECIVRKGLTLGVGLVFAAERLEGGEVYLLDVYQVRGYETAGWCRRGILLEFLPQLKLIEGYFVQTYVLEKEALLPNPSFKVDGIIIHDVVQDVILKYKVNHSIDLVHYRGYFYLPNGRIKCVVKGLEEGSVYEISIRDGSVIRKRPDRFKGNSALQLENVLKNGWNGPAIEPLPVKYKKKAKHK